MATKIRCGNRCPDREVPSEVWNIFKKDLRKIFVIAFPDMKFSITEFYWMSFPVNREYIRITPKSEGIVDWKRVWDVLDFVANEFGIKVEFVYKEIPKFETLKEDSLFERKYSNYSLIKTRMWTIEELDGFLENYSFEELKERYGKSIG